MRFKPLIYCLLVLIISGCAAPFEIAERNMAQLYTPGAQFTEPEAVLNHINDSTSELYVKLQLKHFLYLESAINGKHQANIRLSAKLYNNYESKVILDSTSLIITDTLFSGQDVSMVQYLTIHNKGLDEGIIRLSIHDLNRGEKAISLVSFQKDNLKGYQSFLMLDGENKVIFKNTLDRNDSVMLYCPQLRQGKLFVRFYRRKFPVAVPPFAADQDVPFDYKAENYFEYPVEDYRTAYLHLKDKGFYFFQQDTNDRKGLSIFRFEPGFPELTTIEQMLEPLRYITTSREYMLLEEHDQIKMAIDSFWLEKTGNVNRARSQIAKFYNRVQEANVLFSSYLEGWKTDRGMLYIVLGPPNNVYRQTNNELWVYGEAGYNLSLRFSFVKVNNPFSDNDYSLYRNPMFKEAWYNAVENWRH